VPLNGVEKGNAAQSWFASPIVGGSPSQTPTLEVVPGRSSPPRKPRAVWRSSRRPTT